MLAVIATLLAYGLFIGLRLLEVVPPWWIDVPSVLGFYGPLWLFHDRFSWRWRVGAIRASPIADYSGTWKGELVSSFDPSRPIAIKMVITQRWTKILIRLEAKDSSSFSTMAVVNSEAASYPGLRYEYQSDPKPLSPPGMKPHRGVGNVKLSGDTLEGEYVSGLHRGTSGRITLTRQ